MNRLHQDLKAFSIQTKTRDGKALEKKHVKEAFDETIKAFDYLLGILKNEFSMTNDKPIITNYPLIVAASYIRKNNGKLNTVQKKYVGG